MNKMYALNKLKLTFTLQLGAERLCICINFSKQLVKPPKMVTDNSTFMWRPHEIMRWPQNK